MQRFEKILFINDPANNAAAALQRAVRLTRTNEAKLTIANVIQEIPQTLNSLKKTFLQLQEEQLQSLAAKLATEGLDISTRVLIGTPFLESIKEVIRGGYDLVIKPAEGRGGVSAMLFGNTDCNLFRKCPCPVWIIKPSKQKKYARILAAVDPDPAEKSNAELNKMILDLATSLATRENSELHIVHAWRIPYEHALRGGRASLPISELERHLRDTRKVHKVWLNALLKNYDFQNVPTKVHLLKGDPGEVIPSEAKKKRVELVVMGTVARTGIPGFFIGNTAEKALKALDCSVLTVKPRAFTSPVEA